MQQARHGGMRSLLTASRSSCPIIPILAAAIALNAVGSASAPPPGLR